MDAITNDKVRRLSARKEQQLSDKEYASYLHSLYLKDEPSLEWVLRGNLKSLHFILRALMMASRRLSGIKITKLNTSLPDTNGRPVIYVVTHAGREDITVFAETVNKHFSVLSGDYESLHNNVEGFIIKLNGCIFFDMNSPGDRGKVEQRCVDVLCRGDNILCSMEAAWNLSPNKLVEDLFLGMFRVAIKSDAVIVPVGVERFNGKWYGINVGSMCLDYREYKNPETKESLINMKNDLRQMMADLKFQIYLSDKVKDSITILRNVIGNSEEYEKWFVQDVLSDWTFTEEIVHNKGYKRKDDARDVFSFFETMKPGKRNAFLYRGNDRWWKKI